MNTKPKITVAPDDDEGGFNALRLDWEDGFAEHAGAHHYDTTIDAGVYYAVERIAELEAEREHLISQKNRINEAYSVASKLNSEKNQKLSMKMVELRKLKLERDQLRDALKHLYHNAKASGAEMGLALDVAERALSIGGKR